ncbi:MAG: tetratricopeptide repeat protein [Thermoguttaceae bacterium]|nr:tetratricopeptide repeat protein [Thermoguttaceae bacterium]
MLEYVFTSETSNVNAVAVGAFNALKEGNAAAALRLYLRAIELQPTEAAYHNNCGVALMKLKRLDEAKRAFQNAIELNRNYGDPLVNLANVLITLQENARVANESQFSSTQYDEAERLLRAALQIDGDRLDALLFLAFVLERKGFMRESVATLERARPLHTDPIALERLVVAASVKRRDWATAVDRLELVCAAEPTRETETQLGEYYGRLGRWEKSREHFRKAAATDPCSALRWKYLGYSPVFFQSTDEIDEYWRTLDAALDEAIAESPRFDWRALATEGFIPPFPLAHHNKCCRAIKEKYALLYAPTFSQARIERARRRPGAKLRIGYYASPRETGGFLRSMSGIINRLDPKRFESIVFHHPESAALLRRMVGGATLVDISDSFETAVDRIRDANCDAIYYWKVGGAVWNYFLPMLRLAPIQVDSWGVHGTSGVFDVDYFLSYRLAEIEGAQEHYTEKLVLLDEAPAFQPLYRENASATREALGLPNSGALYFCPHRLAKYHPEFDFYLKGVLESDATGHIIAALGERDDVEGELIRARIERNLGATLAKRIIFRPRLSQSDYGKFLSASTAVLDSAVYSGCLTLYDALSFGVPCVSRVGELLIQRFPVSAYAAMGIENAPLAESREAYVRMATEVGTNADYRRALSQQILERRNCVFERPDAAREFERFWERAVDEVQ